MGSDMGGHRDRPSPVDPSNVSVRRPLTFAADEGGIGILHNWDRTPNAVG